MEVLFDNRKQIICHVSQSKDIWRPPSFARGMSFTTPQQAFYPGSAYEVYTKDKAVRRMGMDYRRKKCRTTYWSDVFCSGEYHT